MSQLSEFKLVEVPPARIIGPKIECKIGHPDGNPIGGFWMKTFGDGTFDKIKDMDQVLPGLPFYGWIGNFDMSARTFDYVIAMMTKTSQEPFDGAVAIDMPALTYAVATITGNDPELYGDAPRLLTAELEKRGHSKHPDLGFVMEGYDPRFDPPAKTKIIQFWMPVAS